MTDLPDPRIALKKGRAVQRSLHRVVDLLKQAEGVGRADAWIDFLPIDIYKYVLLFRARREARSSRQLIQSFQRSLGNMRLDPGIAAKVELHPGVILADVVEDLFGDFLAQSRIERSRRQTNIALSRLRRVLRALEAVTGELESGV